MTISTGFIRSPKRYIVANESPTHHSDTTNTRHAYPNDLSDHQVSSRMSTAAGAA